MFIDIHVHCRRIPGFPYCGKPAFSTPEQLIERYDRLEIEKGVLLPGVNPECAYVPQSNEEVLEVAAATGRFIPFCNIDPRALTNSAFAPLEEILAYYRDRGCRGIGEVCANLHFLDPLVQNLFAAAEKAGLPLTFHIGPEIGNCYGLCDQPGLPELELCLKRFPDLKFFGHSQAFWAEISTMKTPESDRRSYPSGPVTEGRIPELMRRHSNLYGDLSACSGWNALNRDRAHAARFLDEFQDRLMFGTDICAPGTPAPLADLLFDMRRCGEISDPVFRKVARENAIRLLGL